MAEASSPPPTNALTGDGCSLYATRPWCCQAVAGFACQSFLRAGTAAGPSGGHCIPLVELGASIMYFIKLGSA